MIKSYDDLEIYQSAKKLAVQIHQLTKRFPKHEMFELGSQMRRAIISVGANIAEGYGRRRHIADFKRFLEISCGSNNEVRFMLDIVYELKYVDEAEYCELKEQLETLGKRIHATIETWR